ncbi:MAG: PRC-barrel domain-containing protein [Thermomicrobiales bacterium]
MCAHKVDIGAKVTSSDGKDVGNVEKLMLRGDSNQVGGFILSKHLFGTEKIVPARLVANSTEHEVTLSVSSAEAEKLSNVVHTQMVDAPGELTYGIGLGGLVDTAGTGGKWVVRGSSGGQYPHTGSEAFFFEAPIGNVEVENISSLPEGALLISDGTDVVDSEFKKIGRVDEVVLDGDTVTAIIVKAGFIFKHDLQIPVTMIAGASSDHIRLTISADEAEQMKA